MSAPDKPNTDYQPLSFDQAIQFYWDVPNDNGSPILDYRLTLTYNLGTLNYTIPAPAFTYVASGLTNGTTYLATLEARNANGYSPAGTYRDWQSGAAPNPPSTVTVTTSGLNAALVSWTPPAVAPNANIFWYVIETYQVGNSEPIASYSANGTTQSNYYISGLNTSQSYYFNVYSVNCPDYSIPRTTNTISFASINTSNLIIWLDARNTASYPGSGSTWSNLVAAYNTNNYILGNSPTPSNVTYNGVTTSGLSFNGTNQYAVNSLNLQSLLDANSKRETREIWFYWRGGDSVLQAELGSTTPNVSWHDAQITLINTGLWYSYWQNMTGHNVFNSLTSNSWNHIVYQFDNTNDTMQAYVNGVATFSNAVLARTYNETDYYLALATTDTTSVQGVSAGFNGLIAVYRWYNRILTSAQILDNYNSERASFGR